MTSATAALPRPETLLRRAGCIILFTAIALAWADAAFAHAVTLGDKGYIQEVTRVHIIPFLYLGAKHMVTGYDHILFLMGVIFFLYGMKETRPYDPLHRPALYVEGPSDPRDRTRPLQLPSARGLAPDGLTKHQGSQN
jgi:hypothetical protein